MNMFDYTLNTVINNLENPMDIINRYSNIVSLKTDNELKLVFLIERCKPHVLCAMNLYYF